MIFNIFFLIGFVIGIRVVALLLNNRPKPQPDCILHSWLRKDVDKDNPDMGSYLVCTICKRLPSGDKEEEYDRI